MGQLVGLDVAWNKVKDFHTAFNHPVADKPTMLDRERAELRVKWTVDEIQREFLEATDVVGQADAVIDGIYFLLGTLVEMGVQPDNLFNRVNQANMDKLWADGKPHYKPDGKIDKPVGWIAPEPDLLAEIQRQIGA